MKSGAGSGSIQPERPGCPISALKGFGDEDRRLQGAAAAFDEPLTYTGDPTPLTSMQRCERIHSPSCLINSVLGAGLVLEFPVVLVVVDRPTGRLSPSGENADARC
jgi:hypothetical protein